MSREIKFRAWSLGNRLKGIEPHYINDFTIDAFYGIPQDFFDGNRSDDGIKYIEQDTGIEDKSGKRICEGDIVEYDLYIVSGKPAYRVKKQVVFDDMGARVGNDRIRNCSNVEVVGNIHENPELIGDKE